MGRAHLLTPRERSTKGTGGTIRLKVMEYIPIPIMHSMKENGTRTCSMVKAQRSGKMDLFSRVSTEMGKRMVLGSTNGVTEPLMKDNGKIMRFLGMDTTLGQTEGSMWVIGRVILWTGLEFTLGRTVECMKDFIRKIKNMDTVSTPGQT